MNKCNSIEVTNMYSNLSDQTIFRLNEINKIKDFFNLEIWERKIMSKKLNILIDLEISHEEFKTTVNEKEKHENMKENMRNTKSSDEKD